jgi:hypothetical protein
LENLTSGLRILLRILIRSQHEEVFVTQTMLHVDGARTRMPLVCTVISVLVWAVFTGVCFVSCMFATIDAANHSPGANGMDVPQSNTSATNGAASKQRDPYIAESRGRPGRVF